MLCVGIGGKGWRMRWEGVGEIGIGERRNEAPGRQDKRGKVAMVVRDLARCRERAAVASSTLPPRCCRSRGWKRERGGGMPYAA